MLDTMHKDTLKVGDELKLYYTERDYITLTLVRISTSPHSIEGFREGFSWLFTANKECWIDPSIHRVQHETLGDFELGLCQVVPPSTDLENNYFEACFN